MGRLDALLGRSTRANLLEALALSDEPLTLYQVAKTYGMNIAKTYSEAGNLARLGIIKAVGRARGVTYILADEDVRRLVFRMSSRVLTFEKWAGDDEATKRFRSGMEEIPSFRLESPSGLARKPSRLPGELDAMAALGRRKFEKKYRMVADREFASI